MEMVKRDSSFTLTWKVKNFSFCWQRELQFIKRLFDVNGHEWSLMLYPSTPLNCVSCFLRKENPAPNNFLVNYELSFLDENGSPLHSIKVAGTTFIKGLKSVQLWLHHDEIFGNKAAFQQDTLTIQCRVWTDEASIQEMERFFVTTEIKVQRSTFVWHVRGFSSIKAGKKRSEFVKDTLTGNPCISFNLFLDEWNKYILEISILDPKLVEIFKCQVFLLNTEGEKIKCCRFEVVTIGKTTNPDWKFPLSLYKRNLLENKKRYLINNTLSLECEVSFATGIELGQIEKHEFDRQSIQNMTANAEIANNATSFKECMQSSCNNSPEDQFVPLDPKKDDLHISSEDTTSDSKNLKEKVSSEHNKVTSFKECMQSSCNNSSEDQFVPLDPRKDDLHISSEDITSNSKSLKEKDLESLFPLMGDFSAEHYNASLTWKDDILALYKNGMLCDAELHTTSESFPVHTLVLNLRSPIFCDILASDTTSAAKRHIHICDLDSDTARRMILFMYTDTLEDLDCLAAKCLYEAAHRYEILFLKQKCTLFLSQNLHSSNCCDLLLLADRHRDEVLKQVVQNYIAKHDEDIIHSDQWKNLEKTYSSLILETFRFMYLRNRKI